MAMARVCMKNSLMRSSAHLFNKTGPLTSRHEVETRRLGAPSLSCSYSTTSRSSGDENGSDQVVVQTQQGSSALADASASRGGRGLQILKSPWKILSLPFRSCKNEPISRQGSLGSALMQVSDNLNRLLENWTPSRLLGRVKEDDNCYKLRFEVPGLSKQDLKITVEDGFLVITGERQEEEQGDEDDEWFFQRYGYYNTSLLLPDDAKVEEIKAEVKDGLLTVTIPRTGEKKRNVREVEIN